jgi:NADH-quinone oxidoreductase subunit N
MMMFSLAGVPPLAGFFAKFYVFIAAMKAGLIALAIIGVLASVVGAYYYLSIVKTMWFDEPAPAFERMRGELATVLAVTGLFVILFCVYPGPLQNAASMAANSLLPQKTAATAAK